MDEQSAARTDAPAWGDPAGARSPVPDPSGPTDRPEGDPDWDTADRLPASWHEVPGLVTMVRRRDLARPAAVPLPPEPVEPTVQLTGVAMLGVLICGFLSVVLGMQHLWVGLGTLLLAAAVVPSRAGRRPGGSRRSRSAD